MHILIFSELICKQTLKAKLSLCHIVGKNGEFLSTGRFYIIYMFTVMDVSLVMLLSKDVLSY